MTVSAVGLAGLEGAVRMTLRGGLSVAEIVECLFPGATPADWAAFRVNIKRPGGGWRSLPRAAWRKAVIEGQVAVRCVPGGDNLGSLLTIVVTIAAIAAGAFVAPIAAAAFGSAFVGSLAGAAVTGAGVVLGQLAVRALVPPAAPADKRQPSPTYRIDGFRNQANPGGPLPLHLGRNRHAPLYAAPPYSEVVDGQLAIRARFIVGYPDVELTEHEFGETPIGEFGDDVEIEVSDGSTPITLYQGQVLEDGVGATLEWKRGDDDPLVVVRRTRRHTKRAGLIFFYPKGLLLQKEGKLRKETSKFKIFYRRVGAIDWTLHKEVHITEKTIDPFYVYEEVWFADEDRGEYDFKCYRTQEEGAPDDETPAFKELIWFALQSIRPENPTNFGFPIAEVAIRARASKRLSGTIDNYNCIVQGVSLDWDGAAWVKRATRNPAAHYRRLLQTEVKVDPYADAELDLPGLEEWSEQNTAEGATYDRVIDAAGSLYDVLTAVCRAGRATPHDKGDVWTVAVDRPKSLAVMPIGARNSWGFEVKPHWAKPPHAIRGKFIDATNGYNSAEWLVRWPGHLGPISIVETIELEGWTDPTAAFRAILRYIWGIILRPRTYSVYMDIEHLELTRCDLVRLSHFVLRREQVSARILAVGADTITIDEDVAQETGKSYGVRIRGVRDESDPDRSYLDIHRDLVTVPGRSNVLRLSGPGATGATDDLVFVGPLGEETRDVMVRSIEPADNMTALVTFVDHAQGPGGIDAQVAATAVPEWDGIAGTIIDLPAVAPLAPIIDDVISGLAADGDLLVKVKPAPGSAAVAAYKVQHRLVGATTWSDPITQPASAGYLRIVGVYAGPAEVEIRALAVGAVEALESGYSAIWTEIFGQGDVVVALSFFDAVYDVDASSWVYSWDGPGVAGVHIRFKAGAGFAWAALDGGFSGTLTVDPYDSVTPKVGLADTFTIGAIAVDSFGNEQGAPIVIEVPTINFVPSLDFSNSLNSQYLGLI